MAQPVGVGARISQSDVAVRPDEVECRAQKSDLRCRDFCGHSDCLNEKQALNPGVYHEAQTTTESPTTRLPRGAEKGGRADAAGRPFRRLGRREPWPAAPLVAV